MPQYLGDLTENSPLPFSIPIDIKLNAEKGEYITSIKITYKDDLRTEHNLILNETVNYEAVHNEQINNGDNTNTNILGFTISPPPVTTLIITFVLAGIIVVVIIFIVFSIRKRKDKKSKLYKSLNNQDNSGKSFLDDDKDEERKTN
jgi:hypothetical protein